MAQCIVLANGGGGGVNCEKATATASHVLAGRSFGKGDEVLVGTMKNNGAVSATVSRNGRYTIPIGYHNGSGVVRGATITKKNGVTYTPSASTATTNTTVVASGVYMNGDVVIKGDSNLIASNIKKGVTIFGVTGTDE